MTSTDILKRVQSIKELYPIRQYPCHPPPQQPPASIAFQRNSATSSTNWCCLAMTLSRTKQTPISASSNRPNPLQSHRSLKSAAISAPRPCRCGTAIKSCALHRGIPSRRRGSSPGSESTNRICAISSSSCSPRACYTTRRASGTSPALEARSPTLPSSSRERTRLGLWDLRSMPKSRPAWTNGSAG